MTMTEIRRDLSEIRYYYSRKTVFDRAMGKGIQIEAADKAKIYNAAIKNASARLCDLYIALYTENETQYSIAAKWGVSEGYIKNLNRRLKEYLLGEYGRKTSVLYDVRKDICPLIMT